MNSSNKNRSIRRARWSTGAFLLLFLALPAQAQITLAETEEGWRAQMMGLISVWGGTADFDNTGARLAETTTRVFTGFNPSKIEFNVSAPSYHGIEVSSYFQIAWSINGNKSRRTGEQIEVRAADISVGTALGTVHFGRNFGIFDSLAIVNDSSSMRGVGYICVGPDGAGPNCGHIGTGYTWSDWTASIRYTSPRIAGLQLRFGVFDPLERAFGQPGGAAPFIGDNTGTFSLFNVTDFGTDIETDTPMIEAELNWASQPIKLGNNATATALFFGGLLHQKVEDISSNNDTSIKGYSGGGRLTLSTAFGTFGVTGNYSETEGIAEGFIGFGVRCNDTTCEAVEGDQWFVNGDWTIGKTTLGVSYGEGSEDSNANLGTDNVDRELIMIFIQHQLTPNLNINLELQDFERKTDGNGVAAGIFFPQEEYKAVLLGGEFRF